MRLFVLGASGRTGRAFVAQALARGHSVTAFGRSPERLAQLDGGATGRVTALAGDPRNVDELERALAGHDVVVSMLGPSGLGESTLVSDAARATVEAMRATGARRLIIVSVGMLFDDAPLAGPILRRTIFRHVARDAARMERIVAASGLEYTIARPPRLTDGARADGYVATNDRFPPDTRLSLGRASLASFLLDAVERPTHRRRVVGVATPVGRRRAVVYWLATLILATEGIVGGLMGLFMVQPLRGITTHLGYPPYFMSILGLWSLFAGLALLAPRLPRLKEWAYAGLVFDYSSAFVSHLAVGDGARTSIPPIVFGCLAVISWALRPSARRDLSPAVVTTNTFAVRGRYSAIRAIAYFSFTFIVAAEMATGAIWDLARIDYVRTVLHHLGYPLYLLFILGAWKLPCAIVLLVPRFPRLKEWAYAGAIFNYSSAVASHLAAGDGPDKWAAPLIFVVLTLASWALRPPDRWLVLPQRPSESRAAWIVPLIVVAAFVVLALVRLR